MQYTISILVENQPGVLYKVSGLFARRGFNIDSLAVGETEDHTISRITIVVNGDEHIVEQVEKQLKEGQNVVFDVDVVGGCNIKKFYGDRALSVFIQPPSVDELRCRLEGRGTDAPEVIESRIAKAEYELSFAPQFDCVIVNDDLETAKAEALKVIKKFLEA